MLIQCFATQMSEASVLAEVKEGREEGSQGCRPPSTRWMPRWIVFDGAPAVKLLLETVDAPSLPASGWQTFTFRLAPPSSPRSTSKGVRVGQVAERHGTAGNGSVGGLKGAGEAAQVWNVTSSQFADADVSRRGEEAQAVPSSELDEDTFLRVRKRPRRRSTPSQESSEPVKEEARDDFEGESRMSTLPFRFRSSPCAE